MLTGTPDGVLGQVNEHSPAGHGPALLLVPRLSFTETVTDNVRLTAADKEAEAISELSAGIALNLQGARVHGFLDYALTARLYAKGKADDELQNTLYTAAQAELYEDFAYLDARASHSRRASSAFGTQTVDEALFNPNSADVWSYQLSPFLRRRVGRSTSYEVRLSRGVSGSRDTSVSDVSTLEASARLAGGTAETLGWVLSASRSFIDYRFGPRTETDSMTLLLRKALHSQLLLSLLAGWEATDVLTPDKRSYRRYGFGLEWHPTERTVLTARSEQRYFGKSHEFTLSHHTPRTAWIYSNVHDVQLPSERMPEDRGTNFELFFRQLAAVEPDPLKRAVLVSSFLLANGLEPDAPVLSGFLAATLTAQRRQSLSVAYSGQRTVTVVSLQQSRTRRLGAPATLGVDDLSVSESVLQRGGGVTIGRQLTPASSLNVSFRQQRTLGDTALQANRLRSYAARWAHRVNPDITVTLGGRHTQFDSPASPYRENAVVGTINVSF